MRSPLRMPGSPSAVQWKGDSCIRRNDIYKKFHFQRVPLLSPKFCSVKWIESSGVHWPFEYWIIASLK